MSNVGGQERQLAAYIGDFSLLSKFLSKKSNNSAWFILKSLDAFLRGCGQVVFANNPISGLLITCAIAVVEPGLMLLATCTGILGLLLSLLIGEPQSHLENGLTVFNPFLCGAVTYAFIPDIYDSFDGRRLLYFLLIVVISVYLTRAFGSGRLPGLSAPFNVVQLIFLFTLASTGNNVLSGTHNTTMMEHSHSFDGETDPIISNATGENLDWGMVFRGMVTSASQVYAVDNVAVASIIYLAILTYSPITAAFSFGGAALGSLTGLVLNAPVEEAYSGIWGYNGLLTGAALGGFFFVLEFQTTVAAMFGIIFSTVLQHVFTPIFDKLGLPVLSVPFVLTTWLFLGLRGSDGSGFIEPEEISFPEKHRWDFIDSQQVSMIPRHRQACISGSILAGRAVRSGYLIDYNSFFDGRNLLQAPLKYP